MRNLLPFIPQEFLILMTVGAGLLMIVGARRLAATLFGAAMLMAFLPALLGPLFDALPAWVLVGLLVFFGLGLVRALFDLLIGRNSTDHMVGILAADVVRATSLAPFRLIGWVVRALFRRG